MRISGHGADIPWRHKLPLHIISSQIDVPISSCHFCPHFLVVSKEICTRCSYGLMVNRWLCIYDEVNSSASFCLSLKSLFEVSLVRRYCFASQIFWMQGPPGNHCQQFCMPLHCMDSSPPLLFLFKKTCKYIHYGCIKLIKWVLSAH